MLRWLPFLLLTAAALGLAAARNEVKRFLLGDRTLTMDLRHEKAAAAFRGLPETAAETRLKAVAQIRTLRLADTAFSVTVSRELDAEYQAWWRQWETNAERARRLPGQGLTEAMLRKKMREILLDEAWLENRLQSSLPLPEEVSAAYARVLPLTKVPQVQRVVHLFLAQPAGAETDRQKDIQAMHGQLLDSPELWPQLVATHSQDARNRSKAGELGWVSRERMPAELITSLESLDVGQTSVPVRSPMGWHLLRVLERRPARLARADELGPELKGLLWEQKMAGMLKDLSGQP